MKQECWLAAAVSDAALVAEVLLRLKDSAAAAVNPIPQPTWGSRQPRSSADKKKVGRRCNSPTTPLSWSVDSSTDLPPPSDPLRSKISGSAETVTTTSGKRRPRKKTFAELKDEEGSLLKERTHLKKEIAALQLTLVQQRSISNYLKRRKLDFHTGSRINHEANLIEPKEETTNRNQTPEASTCSNVSRQVKCKETPDEPPADACSSEQKGVTSQEHVFELPDLNMTPDEDCVQEEIVGKS